MLAALSQKLPAPIIDSWIQPCRLVSAEGDHLTIAAPNSFSRDWLAQHYQDVLVGAARDSLGGDPRVTLVVDDRPQFGADPPPVAVPATPGRSTSRSPEGLN